MIKLDYNPAKDILSVVWPDLQSSALAEVRHTLSCIVEAVRLYDVKCLLVDTRSTVVDVKDMDYGSIITRFATDLTQTRLQKIARVTPVGDVREDQLRYFVEKTELKVSISSFYDLDEALQWLEE